jgi:glycosyltransferase involved in cell wall biosynthesis
MRIVVLDYSGHIPQADLARNIAKLGHEVTHIHCSDYITGRGQINLLDNDPKNLDFLTISIKNNYNRYNLFYRVIHEIKIAKRFWKIIKELSPDQTIISNVPLIAMYLLSKKMYKDKVPYLYWWQDIYSLALSNKMKIFGLVSLPIRKLFNIFEKIILQNSYSVVAISKNFEPIYKQWDLDLRKFYIYPNWTPPELFLNNNSQFYNTLEIVALYAGTLGIKHQPNIFLDLADSIAFKKINGKIIIISEGRGREYLEKSSNLRSNIELKNFQSLNELNKLFHQSTVLLAILESDASKFSVPSKIMSYLCVGKPIVASIDLENPAAQIILQSGSGVVVSPKEDSEKFVSAVIEVISDPLLAESMGNSGKKYAINNFDGIKAASFFLDIVKEKR